MDYDREINEYIVILRRCFNQIMAETNFTRCITANELNDALIEYDFTPSYIGGLLNDEYENYDKDDDEEDQEVDRGKRKFNQINCGYLKAVKRITDKLKDKKTGKMIYDEDLIPLARSIYAEMLEYTGDEEIEYMRKIICGSGYNDKPSEEEIIRKIIATRENFTEIDVKKKYTFLEAVLLFALRASMRSGTVRTVNQVVDTKNKEKRAKATFDEIKKTLSSKEFSEIFFMLTTDRFFDWISKLNEESIEKFHRSFYLHKTYQKFKKVNKIHLDKDYHVRNKLEKTDGMSFYIDGKWNIYNQQMVYWNVIPLAAYIHAGIVPADLKIDETGINYDKEIGKIEVPQIDFNEYLENIGEHKIEFKYKIEKIPGGYYPSGWTYNAAYWLSAVVKEYERIVVEHVYYLLNKFEEFKITENN
ncbi:MAG: hypothetical protein IKT39_02995 [Clostridia bacterium]|nr:hypothetical protein [Clostridia bacterium]